VKDWSAERVAAAAGARLLGGRPDGPVGFVIDSREVQPGDLFIGLAGAHDDGGRFAQQALEAGAWGALVRPRYAHGLSGTILEHDEPLIALQSLARAWRQALGATVIAITGSTGKTSTKDILAALLVEHRATVASRGNLNTEIGLPLAILSAPAGTEVLVLELAMRAKGAGRDRPAGCRSHRQHRPGAPRAAPLARGDRGGQGRATRRVAARRDRNHSRR
jgi:UDP-N-acetylmuramoyl-tripeptide--D-alanyl-D-alanine ligase